MEALKKLKQRNPGLWGKLSRLVRQLGDRSADVRSAVRAALPDHPRPAVEMPFPAASDETGAMRRPRRLALARGLRAQDPNDRGRNLAGLGKLWLWIINLNLR